MKQFLNLIQPVVKILVKIYKNKRKIQKGGRPCIYVKFINKNNKNIINVVSIHADHYKEKELKNKIKEFIKNMKIDLNNPTFILGDFNNEIKSLKIDNYELSAVNKAIKTCCRMPGGKSKSYTGVYDNILYNKTLVPNTFGTIKDTKM